MLALGAAPNHFKVCSRTQRSLMFSCKNPFVIFGLHVHHTCVHHQAWLLEGGVFNHAIVLEPCGFRLLFRVLLFPHWAEPGCAACGREPCGSGRGLSPQESVGGDEVTVALSVREGVARAASAGAADLGAAARRRRLSLHQVHLKPHLHKTTRHYHYCCLFPLWSSYLVHTACLYVCRFVATFINKTSTSLLFHTRDKSYYIQLAFEMNTP